MESDRYDDGLMALSAMVSWNVLPAVNKERAISPCSDMPLFSTSVARVSRTNWICPS